MASQESVNRSRPVLLVGAGKRPKELGAVLSALGALRARSDGEAAIEPHRPMGLADLEELLAQRPAEGTLILDYERVPGEDIGFVRRFLERHAEWRLVVVGEDVRDRRARGLLALPRTQWLPWPPDLDQIGALLPVGDETSAAVAGDSRKDEPRIEERRRKTSARSGAPSGAGSGEPFDLGALLEELLAGAALDGEGAPRYLYRCDQSLLLYRDRALLATSLGDLLALARHGAGEGGVVSAQIDPDPAPGDPADTARIRIEFPAGEIGDDDWNGILEGRFDAAGRDELGDVVERCWRAAGALRNAGVRVSLTAGAPDRLQFEVHVASEAVGESAAPRKRQAKAQDPFA